MAELLDFLDSFFGPSGATVGDSGSEMTPEANAFIDAISDNESAGQWNVIYGGQTFDDYSKHPGVFVKIKSGPNKGQYSSAAGKFQILKSTYDKVAPRLGITDFSPESQKRIAWYLAQEKIPNLQQELESADGKKVAELGKKLSGVWTSLSGGIEATQSDSGFAKAYEKHLGEAATARPGFDVPSLNRSPFEQKVMSFLDTKKPEAKTNASKDYNIDAVVKMMGLASSVRNVAPSGGTPADLDLAQSGTDLASITPSLNDRWREPLPMPSRLTFNVDDVRKGQEKKSIADIVKMVNEQVIGGSDTSSKNGVPNTKIPLAVPKMLAFPIDSQKKAPAPVKVPVAPTTKPTNSTPAAGSAQSQDSKLAALVQKMTVASNSAFKTNSQQAGKVALPDGVVPAAAKAGMEQVKAATAKPATPTKPAWIQPPVIPNGTASGGQVSLSNPVLKPIAVTPQATAKPTVVQTAQKPLDPALAALMTQVLADPMKKPATAKPAWGATPPQITTDIKPVADPTKPAAQKPVVAPVIPLAKPASIQEKQNIAGAKAAAAAGKPLTTASTGEVKKTTSAIVPDKMTAKGNPSMLDMLGDIFLNSGAGTMQLLGDAVQGKSTVSAQTEALAQQYAQTGGAGMTAVNQLRAQGLTPSQAYEQAGANEQAKARAVAAANNSGKVPGASSSGRIYNADTNSWDNV